MVRATAVELRRPVCGFRGPFENFRFEIRYIANVNLGSLVQPQQAQSHSIAQRLISQQSVPSG